MDNLVCHNTKDVIELRTTLNLPLVEHNHCDLLKTVKKMTNK
jgi:hypothetical protein